MSKEENMMNENLDDDVCVTLELDNGETIECEILTIFDINDRSYIVLEPQDQANDPTLEESDIFVYRYIENGDEYTLENIEDDEEYEAVSDYIDELLDESFYNSLED